MIDRIGVDGTAPLKVLEISATKPLKKATVDGVPKEKPEKKLPPKKSKKNRGGRGSVIDERC